MELGFADGYYRARLSFFRWRHELGFANKLLLALSMACVTGLLAQLRVYLPFTPVPLTGQVFAVLLSGVLLGRWAGGASQGLYVGLGLAGVPWFSGMRGGPAVVLGVDGGYLVGFIVVAFLVGHITERHIRARSLTVLLPMLLGCVGVIYLMGAAWFAVVMGTGLWATLALAVLPFVPLDLAKAAGVALIGKAVTPKESYNGEVDAEAWGRWRLP